MGLLVELLFSVEETVYSTGQRAVITAGRSDRRRLVAASRDVDYGEAPGVECGCGRGVGSYATFVLAATPHRAVHGFGVGTCGSDGFSGCNQFTHGI